jgi:short-subunit dehydrogenase
MTRAILPHMHKQGAGRIINIGSMLGLLPMPYVALYAATKHVTEGYSKSLDHELRTRGIRVSVIEPGYTKTPFGANFLTPDAKPDAKREARAAVSQIRSGEFKLILPYRLPLILGHDVAGSLVKGWNAGAAVQVG